MKGFPLSVVVVCTRGVHRGRIGVVPADGGGASYNKTNGAVAIITLYKPGQTKELDTETVVAPAEDWECYVGPPLGGAS